MRIRAVGAVKDPTTLVEARLPGRRAGGTRVAVPVVPDEPADGEHDSVVQTPVAELRDAQPKNDERDRQIAELKARWERGVTVCGDHDIIGDDELFGQACAKLRFLECSISYLEQAPERTWCPYCGGERSDGTTEYNCLAHAEQIIWPEVNRLRTDQGW